MDERNSKYVVFQWLISVALLVDVLFLGYFTPRGEFNLFFSLYSSSFLLFYLLWLNRANFNWRTFICLAIALRILLLFCVPQLSNDFYRFLWDGEIMTMGFNPYSHTPDELMSYGTFMADPYLNELFAGMGPLSAGHYSCYPILNQLFFLIAVSFSNSIAFNVIMLKLVIILADIGTILIGRKILNHLNLPEHKIWLYALNPIVLIEFTGNAHFDGVMVFFVVTACWFVLRTRWLAGAVFFGLAIHVKLVPLILLPFAFKKLGWFKSLGFTAASLFTAIGLGLTLINGQLFFNAWQSIEAYFISFEFNGSIYAIFRAWDFATLGWNNIAENGPMLAKISFVFISALAFFRACRNDADIFKGMMFAMLIYLGFATTVHPWYIALPLILSVFSKYKAVLVWSLTVMLSYSAYQFEIVRESAILTAFEYLSVALVLGYEIFRSVGKENFGIQLREFFDLSKRLP